MLKTGDKPDKGTYKCTLCGQLEEINDHNDTLPLCLKCQGVEWTKI